MTTINPPQIACYITSPHGVQLDYAPYLEYESGVSYTQNFGRQGDTMSLTIIDDNYSTGEPPNLMITPSFAFPSFSQVKVEDLNAVAYYGDEERGTLFAGYVTKPTLTISSPTQAQWGLECVDYSGYANAAIVQSIFDGVYMGDAIVDLVRKANCGIKAATITNGGYVQIGPRIPRTVIHYTNLTQGLQKISQMASSASAYGWYVDSSLNLHFYDQQQASTSGVTVTDSPTQSGLMSFTECHIQQGSLSYEFDGSSIFNRALCVGASKSVQANPKKAATATITADGHTYVWPLSQVPDAAGTPVVHVNGIAVTCNFYDGSTTLTTNYALKQNADGSWVLAVNLPYGKVPATNSIIKVWYAYRTTITAQVDLQQSQNAIGGPNNGIFATVVNQKTISTTTAAYQRAVRDLAEYGHAQERITFTTSPEWVGVWRAGETFTLDSKLLLDSQRNFTSGLNATFMIMQQTVNFDQNSGFRTCSVQAVRIV